MKTQGLFTVLLIIIFISCNYAQGDDVKGNGNLITKDIRIDQFRDIDINETIKSRKNVFRKGTLSFQYKQSPEASLQITIDENLYPLLDIVQSDGKLKIGTKNNVQIKATSFMIAGSSENLSNVDIRGVMDFISESPLTEKKLSLNIIGVGDIIMTSLSCDELKCSISGVGNIDLKGNVDNGDYSLSGVGKVKAFDCSVRNLTCRLSGVGNMQVAATEHLDALTSGVGNIRYKGEASVNTNSSGVGNIKKAD